MTMSGYTKLFSSIVASTIWREDDKTRILWITLLALSDKDGFVAGSIPGLADMARMSIADCEQGLQKLQQPDLYSRTPDHEGRRIEVIDGGWLILNRAKYRDLIPDEQRRERDRIRQQRHRSSASHVTGCDSHDSSHQTKEETEEEKEKEKIKTSSSELKGSSNQATDFGESGSKENPSPKAPSHEANKLAALLSGEISKNAPHFRITTAQQRKWSGIADLMLRRDHRSYDEIASIIQWCQADEFWRSNVLSMQKVREKFDQLELKRGTAGGKSRAQTVPSPDYTRGLEGFVVRGASNEGNL